MIRTIPQIPAVIHSISQIMAHITSILHQILFLECIEQMEAERLQIQPTFQIDLPILSALMLKMAITLMKQLRLDKAYL